MFRQRLQSFMIGRNGFDSFCRFLTFSSAILVLLSMFTQSGVLYLIALFLLGYSYFRMMSKNLGNRTLENQRYLRIADRVRQFFKDGPKLWKIKAFFREFFRKIKYGSNTAQERAKKRSFEKEQKKIYKFYTCKSCGQKVRVPRGKGKIEITCPKCRTSFIKRT